MALQGGPGIYREVLFELAEARATTPLFAAILSDRLARARMQALLLSEEAVTVLFDVAGPAGAVARVRDVLRAPLAPHVLHSDLVVDAEKHLRFVMTWRRPADDGMHGVSLEHLLLDTVGPGGLLFGRVEAGVISYKAASPGGRGLTEFLAAAQAAFHGRFKVRPLRAGPFRAGWEIDDPAGVDPEEEALLAAALAHGYYDEPKRCGVRELGETLGVSKSVVARRLRDLERRALERMVS